MRLGRARSSSGGSASRCSAVSTLWLSTVSRSQAALAPKRPQGITPPASSLLITSCRASIEPAFSRCHSSNRLGVQSQTLLTTAKYFTTLPSANRVSSFVVNGYCDSFDEWARPACEEQFFRTTKGIVDILTATVNDRKSFQVACALSKISEAENGPVAAWVPFGRFTSIRLCDSVLNSTSYVLPSKDSKGSRRILAYF